MLSAARLCATAHRENMLSQEEVEAGGSRSRLGVWPGSRAAAQGENMLPQEAEAGARIENTLPQVADAWRQVKGRPPLPVFSVRTRNTRGARVTLVNSLVMKRV